MSLFITFEGPEGSGKTTQIRALSHRLGQSGQPLAVTEEPGGTALGLKLRRLLKETRDAEISPLAELLLFAASRSQLVAQVIKPSLASGCIVLCDRYAESSVAYQGHGRDLSLDLIATLNQIATEGLRPDLIILLDLPVEVGLHRKRAEAWDRFETEELGFHQRVRQGYLKMASAEPERWLVIDATTPPETIERLIWARVSGLLSI